MDNRVGHLLRAARLRFLGVSFIYERFRPWFLGYHDLSNLYQFLNCQKTDIILDIGCGRGAAFKFLSAFESYHGFDVDTTALDRLRKQFTEPNIHCHLGEIQASDLSKIQPTKVLMMGLLHHLEQDTVLEILNMLRDTPTIEKIITLDPITVPLAWLNNLLCRSDAGRYVRFEDDLLHLVEKSGLDIKEHRHTRSGNGCAHYLEMCIER